MKKQIGDKQPVVVGFGPAGMFITLILAELGMKPIVLERGEQTTYVIERIGIYHRDCGGREHFPGGGPALYGSV